VSFSIRKQWSDKFLPEMKSILGGVLLSEPPCVEDICRNTDLVVLHMANVRIACRVRKHAYLKDYGSEFTLRSKSPNGGMSELSKVVSGWGDYLLYAFCDESEMKLEQWIVGDLSVFRLWFARQCQKTHPLLPGVTKTNADGSITITYSDGTTSTIAAPGGNTNVYKGSGSTSDPLTLNGIPFTGTRNGARYINGVLQTDSNNNQGGNTTGSGTASDPLLVNGKAFNGMLGGVNYVNGVAQQSGSSNTGSTTLTAADIETKARRTAQQD